MPKAWSTSSEGSTRLPKALVEAVTKTFIAPKGDLPFFRSRRGERHRPLILDH
jgi:hypothetical protein